MRRISDSKHKWLYIFIASFASFLLAVCLLLIKESVNYGSFADGMAHLSTYVLGDFGQTVYFSISENPYTALFRTMYTPLTLLFYKPFALICRTDETFYLLGSVTADEFNSAILQTWQFWVSYIGYCVIVFTVLFLILKKTFPVKNLSDKFAFFFSIVFSTLLGYAFMRGSNIFIALIFFIAYINWYDSDVKWKREVSLIFFAIAGTVKFYTLFGGILLLKEKRWLDAVKCIIYFLLCMFVPFFFYDSPFDTMAVFVNNMFTFMGNEGRIGTSNNISVYSLVYSIFSVFGAEESVIVTVLCWLVTLCVFACFLFVCLKTSSRFTSYISICCAVSLIIPVSYLYTLAFMVLPVIEFINEKSSFGIKRRVFYYIVFAVMMFTPLILTGFFLLYTLVLVAVVIVEMINLLKENHEKSSDLSVPE